MTAETVIARREHWTSKGDVRLFLWEKRAGATEGPLGTILFVHGSSMASNPTFDLQVPGGHARDRPRVAPAEELSDRPSHPAQFLQPTRPDVSGRVRRPRCDY